MSRKARFFIRVIAGYIAPAAAVFLSGFFVFYPAPSRAALDLPAAPCDDEQVDAILPGFGTTAHLVDGMSREDGVTAFEYGVNNENFVSIAGDVLTFRVNLLFAPNPEKFSTIKLLAFDADCNIVFGFGPSFLNLVPGENIITYNRVTNEVTLNGLLQIQNPSGVPRYVWVEVVDAYPDAALATYSYLIDNQNPQNPTGQAGERRLDPDPVIVIPGILGSQIKNGEFVLDPIFHTYDDLLDTLRANGYEDGKDLFEFPYNWRRSNRETALLLERKINQVQEKCQCDKVDLVTHSMGGLVARQYIQSGRYENDVDQLIFLGTPHLGASKAYLTWEGGETGPNREDSLLKFILSSEAKKEGFRNLFEYVRERPISTVNELLPIHDYLLDKNSETLRQYPENYPQNGFLEMLENNILILLNSKVNFTNIVGRLAQDSTISEFRVINSPSLPKWEHGYPEGFDERTGDRGLIYGPGDGTVPKASGERIAVDLNVLDVEHRFIPEQAAGLIYKRLTGKDPSVIVDKTRIPNVVLIFKMLSPADFVVIAPDGKRIGKNFETGGEINEIEGAFYSGFLTDDEFITIPDPLDGEYKVITQGTDAGGSYTVSVGYVADEILVERDFEGQILPGAVQELLFSLNNDEPEQLAIEPLDNTPPTITILSPQSKDYLRSEALPVSVDIHDDLSGVFSSKIELDGAIINNDQIIDLFFHKLGEHKLSVEAQDFVGNIGNDEVGFRVVTTIRSTISDVERAYQLGWIKNKGIKTALVKILENAGKIKNRQGKIGLYRAFSSILKSQRGKSINEQAHELLSEDLDWLINNN